MQIKIISPADALRLESAKITPRQLKAAESLAEQISRYIELNMTRHGVVFWQDEVDQSVAMEVVRAFKAAGWVMAINVTPVPSAIQGGKPKMRWAFNLSPKDEHYDEVDFPRPEASA